MPRFDVKDGSMVAMVPRAMPFVTVMNPETRMPEQVLNTISGRYNASADDSARERFRLTTSSDDGVAVEWQIREEDAYMLGIKNAVSLR